MSTTITLLDILGRKPVVIGSLADIAENPIEHYLSSEDLAWLDERNQNAKRVDYYDLTPSQCRIVDIWSAYNSTVSWFPYTWENSVHRLGLVYIRPSITYQTDDNGERILDSEGNPIVESAPIIGEVKFSVNVSVEGLKDSKGAIIPKGKCSFGFTNQTTNRRLNESNWKGNLIPRFAKFLLNGETMIKDALFIGMTEQHRLVADIVLILSGKASPDGDGQSSFTIDGIHRLASVTCDTGKSNSGSDIFGSDPELLPLDEVRTVTAILSGGDELESNVVEIRDKVLRELTSAANMVTKRLAGKTVDASVGNSNYVTERSHQVATRLLPDLDRLCLYCFQVISTMPSKVRPCSASELASVLALWYVGQEVGNVDTLPRERPPKGWDGGTPLEEAEQVRFDLERVIPFLRDLSESVTTGGPLEESVKTIRGYKSPAKVVKIARLQKVVSLYMMGETIAPELLHANRIGKTTDGQFPFFGGLDRGPFTPLKGDE